MLFWKSLYGTASFYSGKDSALSVTYWPNFLPFRTFKSSVISAPVSISFFLNVPNQSKHGAQRHLSLPQITHESRLFHGDSVVKAGVVLKCIPPADDLRSNSSILQSLGPIPSPSLQSKVLSSKSKMTRFSHCPVLGIV